MSNYQEEMDVLRQEFPKIKSKKKKADMRYLEVPEDPTWFQTEQQALQFLEDLEKDSGIHHVLEYRKGGYAVVPFFLQDADGENIGINDVIYDCDNQAYLIQQFSRVGNTAWEAVAENEKQKRTITKETGSEYRHNLWTKAQLKKRKREYYIHHISSEIIKWARNNEIEIIKGCVGVLFLIPVIMAVVVSMNMAKNGELNQTSSANTSVITEYPCTISELEAKERKIEDINGDVSTKTYYFLTVTDPSWGYDVRFSCSEDLWKNLKEGENVTLMQEEKDAPLLWKMGGATKTKSYTINGYSLNDFYTLNEEE